MRAADPNQLALDSISTSITSDDLVRWLDREVRQPDVPQAQLLAYLLALVGQLTNEQRVPLNTLARMRFVLAQRIDARIEELRRAAATTSFRQLVLDGGWLVEPDWQRSFTFEPGRYAAPAGTRYSGRWQFAKHYYPVIADLKASGEEFECARLVDRHPKVKHWVRNLDSEPFGFWLPTSRYRFFPDFLVELTDGRIGAIEYKGEHLRHDPGEIEKRQVGELWAARSDGRCVFRFVLLNDGNLDVQQQMDSAFRGS
jgi:type III restriction enzyme